MLIQVATAWDGVAVALSEHGGILEDGVFVHGSHLLSMAEKRALADERARLRWDVAPAAAHPWPLPKPMVWATYPERIL